MGMILGIEMHFFILKISYMYTMYLDSIHPHSPTVLGLSKHIALPTYWLFYKVPLPSFSAAHGCTCHHVHKCGVIH